MSMKEVNGHPSVDVACKMIETVELANPTQDTAPEAGSEAGTLCMLDNEFGRGNLKLLATPIGAQLGTSSIREVVEGCKDIECVIVTAIKHDKKNDVNRMNIKELHVV